MALRLGGETEIPPWHHLPFDTSQGGSYRGLKYGLLTVWVSPSQAQGPLHGRSSWKTDCLGLQWTQLALHLSASYMRAPALCHSPRRGTWASYLKEGWKQPLQANQLTGSLSTPHHQFTGCLPNSLNGCKEPVITSLLEPLANGISLTAGEPVYLEIDITPSLVEELDWKVLPIGEVSTTMIASPHRYTPQNWKERAECPWR